jgi:hypothetical protein
MERYYVKCCKIMKVAMFLRVNAVNCDNVIGYSDIQDGTWRKLGAE